MIKWSGRLHWLLGISLLPALSIFFTLPWLMVLFFLNGWLLFGVYLLYKRSNMSSLLRRGGKVFFLTIGLFFLSTMMRSSVIMQDGTSYTAGLVNDIKASAPLKVHFIYVGQADSTLVQAGKHAMLIDGGTNADSELVVDYLKSQGVQRLDYVIATHPHQDHVGGLDAVIRCFSVNKVIVPEVSHDTKTYQDFLAAAQEKKIPIVTPALGKRIGLGKAYFTLIAPNSSGYKRLNDYSIVTKLVYKKNTFLFQGDAESVSEQEILDKKYNIRADVLKVGHHGHISSTSTAYLQQVHPRFAVISAGKDNEYNLPNDLIVNRLAAIGTQIFRTDQQGTIIAVSNGKKITFNKKPWHRSDPVSPSIMNIFTSYSEKLSDILPSH